MQIGSRIKKARELRNYSQQFMADRLEMSVAGYSKIERDEVNLNLDKLEKIAEILETKVNRLMELDEKFILESPSFNDHAIAVLSNSGKINIYANLEKELQDLKKRVEVLEKREGL